MSFYRRRPAPGLLPQIALFGRPLVIGRILLVCGCIAGILAALASLPGGSAAVVLPTELAGQAIGFQMTADGLWLFGFGLAPAALACALGTPAGLGRAGWLFGAAASLIGALGVFGIQDGAGFLIAWEIMELRRRCYVALREAVHRYWPSCCVHARSP